MPIETGSQLLSPAYLKQDAKYRDLTDRAILGGYWITNCPGVYPTLDELAHKHRGVIQAYKEGFLDISVYMGSEGTESAIEVQLIETEQGPVLDVMASTWADNQEALTRSSIKVGGSKLPTPVEGETIRPLFEQLRQQLAEAAQAFIDPSSPYSARIETSLLQPYPSAPPETHHRFQELLKLHLAQRRPRRNVTFLALTHKGLELVSS